MEAFEIVIYPREDTGKLASRRYRRQGMVPSIIYSHGQPGLPVLVRVKEFTKLARMVRSSQLISFKSSISELSGKAGVVKEIQLGGVSDDVLHVDFQAVSEFEEIRVKVALKFLGEAPGVKVEGGILTVAMREVSVTCLPKLIPQEITCNISELKLGHSLHVRDLMVPQGVRVDEDAEETVVSVTAVHVVVEEAPAAAEVVEGEEAAEGAAPAEGEEGEAQAASSGEEGEKKVKEGREAKEGKETREGKGKGRG